MRMIDSFYRLLDIAPSRPGQTHFFIQPFRLRPPEEIAQVFEAGGNKTTPQLSEIATSKISLWVFAQIGFIGVSAFVLLCFLLFHFGNIKLLPALIVVGAFAMPMACLMFFWEINAPKNIPLFMVMFVILVAGVLGVANSLFLFDATRLSASLGPPSAGLIEEPGKLAAVLLLIGRKPKYPWLLNGLLFGAAVGTGFAAFESAGYAFEVLANTGSVEQTIEITVLRGVLSPFCHVIWTAATSAALWKAMAGQAFSAKVLGDGKFLKVFAAVVCLHMFWNSSFSLFPILNGLADAKVLLLGWLGWIIILGLAKEGYAEINAAQRRLPKMAAVARLIMAGSNFRDAFELRNGRTTLGRDIGNDIVLGHPGISRRHAHISRAGDGYILADLGSVSGTYVNGEKIISRKLGHRDTIGICGIELRFERD